MTDCENLRRSKRNKYHLDVASLNLANPEKRRASAIIAAAALQIQDDEPVSPSPGTSAERTPEVPEITQTTEENKRSRRPTTKNASFVYADESEDEDDKVTTGMFGTFKCEKCPSRFESRPGLANHIRLHGRSDKRKFGCDQCDFSCGSAKAIRNHKRIHSRPFKEESPCRNSDTRSDTSDSHTPPLLTPVRPELPNTQTTPPNGGPPQLAAISPADKKVRSANRKRNRCPECPFAVRNRRRFERHLLMHNRASGFQCHSCSLTTVSSGFLKRHIVEIHKETDFPWPPKFIDRKNSLVSSKVKKEEGKADRAMILLRQVKIMGEKFGCPVDGCSYFCYTRGQMVLHKRRNHMEKPLRPVYRCCSCGLKLRSPGALRVHRLIRHPMRKMSQRTRKSLYKESNPRSYHKKIILEMRKNAGLAGSSDPSTPSAPSPLSVSQSAPSLSTMEQETVSSSLLGIELSECLKGMTFGVAELAAELAKSHENEFKCEECPFSTNAKTKLERHMVKHEIKSDVQCPLCSFSCRGDDLIKQHVRLHMAIIHKHRQETEKLTCDVSLLGTPTISPAKQKSEEASTPLRLNGEKKDKVTIKRKKPSNIFINKDGIRMRRCLECPYATKHACDLASHFNMHVNAPQRYKCTQCTYSTKRAVSLKSHYACHKDVNAAQREIKPFQLKLNGIHCGYRCGQGKHRMYQCKTCPFVSRSIVSLHHHYRNHLNTKGATYKCSKCPFYSIFAESIEEHLLIHDETDATTERLVPLTRTTKKNAEESNGKNSKDGRASPVVRPKRTSKVNSSAPSPLPILSKEEPMEYETTMDTDEDTKDTSASSSSSIKVEENLFDQPLSIEVQELFQPEPLLMKLIQREKKATESGQCPDCPYRENDELMMRLHRECHAGPPKIQKCDLCSFSCMAPEALHKHIALHLPALSPNSAAQERKKAAHRRRAQATEVIPQGVPHFSCNKCTYKCMTRDSFQEHMMFHAQELQRRLMTTIKRANVIAEESKTTKAVRRVPKKSDKFNSCVHCSFRCETFTSYIRHLEMHSLQAPFKCRLCNYSANTASITQYHEMNHHSDHTLAGLSKSALLAPYSVEMVVRRSAPRTRKAADIVYTCLRCPGFVCYEIQKLRRHFEIEHNTSEEDKESIESMALGMLPRNSLIIPK